MRVRTCVMSPQPLPPRCRHHERSPHEGHMDTRPPRVQRSCRHMGSLALPRRLRGRPRWWLLSAERHLRRWLPRITRDVSTPPVTRRSLLCTHNNFCILWFQFSLSMPSTVNYSGCTYPLCSEFLHLLSTVHVLILPLKPYSVYELQANHNRMHTTA